jgi:hypothetical protein
VLSDIERAVTETVTQVIERNLKKLGDNEDYE